jgi:hypothetical protein
MSFACWSLFTARPGSTPDSGQRWRNSCACAPVPPAESVADVALLMRQILACRSGGRGADGMLATLTAMFSKGGVVSISFVLAMFVMPAAIIAVAFLLAGRMRTDRRR